MRQDAKLLLQNPTPLEITQYELMKIQEDTLKELMGLIETYLNEYGEVNGITESELNKHLAVGSCPQDSSVMVINVDDIRDVKFGIKIAANAEKTVLTIFGEYLDCKDSYPKTTGAIKDYERRGV